MKKMRALKILTGFTVGLAVCVAALFAYTIISPDVAERKSADIEVTQEQTAGVVIEEVKQASASVTVPQKSEKSVSLYTEAYDSETEVVEEYYDEYYEEYDGAELCDFSSAEVMGEETWEEETWEEETWEDDSWEDDSWEDNSWEDDSWEDDSWEDDTWTDDSWEDDTWTDDSWEDDYSDDWEEPTTNVPDPVISDGNLTEGNLIAAQIAKYAETFVGVLPYNWAHHSLDPNEGADCSGFTHALYEAFGYDWLSYNDYGQSLQGRSVLYEEWLPGDILCFYGHVGIYVGDGLMVHCPEPGRYVEYCSATYTYPFDVRRMIE